MTPPKSIILPHARAFNKHAEYEEFKKLGEVILKRLLLELDPKMKEVLSILFREE